MQKAFLLNTFKNLIPNLACFLCLLMLDGYHANAQPGHENIPANVPAEQKWWNLLHYTIDLKPDYASKFITGSNAITFRALETGNVMEVSLIEPLKVTAVSWHNKPLIYQKKTSDYFISFPGNIKKGDTATVTIVFEGKPIVANRPPWDNGWIWATDKKGRPWMSIACEGYGAAAWLPCKNVLYDEPDSGVLFSITVPDTLVAVANGRLQKQANNHNGTSTYTWKVVNPINNYDIIPYIGKYVTWHNDYAGLKGKLDRDYWVLDYNLDKAKKHLQQTDTLLRCLEYWCGPYPFYEDGYKIVEAPMVGMEHQSAIAYGNGFENGYSGKNLSGTQWGLKWDFVLMHETGHEWFGNSITASNDGESWIHEGFTKYLETIYTTYLYGTEAGNDYTLGIWKRIVNDVPVLGSGSQDAYNKGCAMLHAIRQIVGDTVFRGLLTGLNKEFYHSTVSTPQILRYMNAYTKKDLSKLVDQYLTTTKIPVLEYFFKNDTFNYRWVNCVNDFNMPVKASFSKQKGVFIYPTTAWKTMPADNRLQHIFIIDPNFYVQVKEVKPG